MVCTHASTDGVAQLCGRFQMPRNTANHLCSVHGCRDRVQYEILVHTSATTATMCPGLSATLERTSPVGFTCGHWSLSRRCGLHRELVYPGQDCALTLRRVQ